MTNRPRWQQAAACPTLLSRGFDTGLNQLWVPCVARSLNRSRVVAREGTCIYPAGGVPISSRAPAHGRLALGGPSPLEVPASGGLA